VSNPFVEESAYWDAALEHYHWDRVVEAFETIHLHGVGEAGSFIRWYRLIESEAFSRKISVQQAVNEWLTFEFVPSEVGDLADTLIQETLAACEEIGQRLGWDHSVPTLLAVLAEATDAPWATNPYGYCTDKENFMKICLPAYLVDDLEEFRQAVAHEYAHVITMNLADGQMPRWLEEAISVLAEHSLSSEAWEEFCEDDEAWLSPEDLEIQLESRGEEGADRDEVWYAYQQCGWIGRYLATLGDESKLGDLLREHAHEGFFRNIRLALTGRDRVDGALQATYGLTVRELFARALDYARSQPNA